MITVVSVSQWFNFYKGLQLIVRAVGYLRCRMQFDTLDYILNGMLGEPLRKLPWFQYSKSVITNYIDR